jgi:hypothetical protein
MYKMTVYLVTAVRTLDVAYECHLILTHVTEADLGHGVVGWPYQFHSLNMCEKQGHPKLYAIL